MRTPTRIADEQSCDNTLAESGQHFSTAYEMFRNEMHGLQKRMNHSSLSFIVTGAQRSGGTNLAFDISIPPCSPRLPPQEEYKCHLKMRHTWSIPLNVSVSLGAPMKGVSDEVERKPGKTTRLRDDEFSEWWFFGGRKKATEGCLCRSFIAVFTKCTQ